jgi:hypothetical protein
VKTTIIPIILALLLAAGATAQECVTLRLGRAAAEDLLREVEQQTSYRIYARPTDTDTDTVVVTITCTNADAVDVVRQALAPAGLKVSVFGSAMFVALGRELITALPPGYYQAEDADATGSVPDLWMPDGESTRKASSENLVY